MLKLSAKTTDIGKRADVFVTEKLPKFSRSSLSGLFDKDQIYIRKLPIKAAHKLKAGDVLVVNTKLLRARPPSINLPIVYEDKDVIVINKPAGILTHSKGALNTEATVASWLIQHLKKGNYNIKSSFPGFNPVNNRLGIVHRLDRQTSGVMICAKNEQAQQWLQKQFSKRKVKKIYWAVVEEVPEPTIAIIDAPIERNPKRPQTFRVEAGGKPAQTRYKVRKIINPGASKPHSLLELQPLTGKTHQLRVHMKYIGHPIFGDQLYGQGSKHMYLHAKLLELKLPNGHKMQFKAPEPEYFINFTKT